MSSCVFGRLCTEMPLDLTIEELGSIICAWEQLSIVGGLIRVVKFTASIGVGGPSFEVGATELGLGPSLCANDRTYFRAGFWPSVATETR